MGRCMPRLQIGKTPHHLIADIAFIVLTYRIQPETI